MEPAAEALNGFAGDLNEEGEPILLEAGSLPGLAKALDEGPPVVQEWCVKCIDFLVFKSKKATLSLGIACSL
jgi:hypothetical protein